MDTLSKAMDMDDVMYQALSVCIFLYGRNTTLQIFQIVSSPKYISITGDSVVFYDMYLYPSVIRTRIIGFAFKAFAE